jgi:hypothetical protein
MKRLIAIWIICASLSLGSLGLLIAADRRLGVPLPYSASLALFAVVAIGPAFFAVLEWIRGRRPIVVQVAPVPETEPFRATAPADPPRRRRARGIEGVVLLDCSTFAPGVRAA